MLRYSRRSSHVVARGRKLLSFFYSSQRQIEVFFGMGENRKHQIYSRIIFHKQIFTRMSTAGVCALNKDYHSSSAAVTENSTQSRQKFVIFPPRCVWWSEIFFSPHRQYSPTSHSTCNLRMIWMIFFLSSRYFVRLSKLPHFRSSVIFDIQLFARLFGFPLWLLPPPKRHIVWIDSRAHIEGKNRNQCVNENK